jgi:hypothetical protein
VLSLRPVLVCEGLLRGLVGVKRGHMRVYEVNLICDSLANILSDIFQEAGLMSSCYQTQINMQSYRSCHAYSHTAAVVLPATRRCPADAACTWFAAQM